MSAVAASFTPLTTIFSPPSDCFNDPPQIWTDCNLSACFLSVGRTCYPAAAPNVVPQTITYTASIGTTAEVVTTVIEQEFWLAYSPGILPLGFSGYTPTSLTLAQTTVCGCPPNWVGQDTCGDCSSLLSGTYLYGPKQTTSGIITAILPGIQVAWASSDLSRFTPASAPILAPSVIASIWAGSTSAGNGGGGRLTSTGVSHTLTTQPTLPTTTSSTSTAQSKNSPQTSSGSGKGLSTGAKAGIGVGVALAVLLLIMFVMYCLRRRRTKPAMPKRTESKRPYVDSKPELDATSGAQRDDAITTLGNRETPELYADPVTPPPIPFASKPRHERRLTFELDGGFKGHESAEPRSPMLVDGARGSSEIFQSSPLLGETTDT